MTPDNQKKFDELKKKLTESVRRQVAEDEQQRKETEAEEARWFDQTFFDCMAQVDEAESKGEL